MKIVIDGRRIGKRSWAACYDINIAYFRKKKISKSLVLHEFYHHLLNAKNWKIVKSEEEKEANGYARSILKGI
jgi:hypothetical protein